MTSRSPGSSPRSGLLVGGICLGFALLVLILLSDNGRAADAYDAATVHAVDGTIHIESDVTQTWHAYVGGIRFSVDVLQAQAIRDDGFYRVYYVVTGGRSVSPLGLELIGVTAPKR